MARKRIKSGNWYERPKRNREKIIQTRLSKSPILSYTPVEYPISGGRGYVVSALKPVRTITKIFLTPMGAAFGFDVDEKGKKKGKYRRVL